MKNFIISTDVLKPVLNNLAQAVAKSATVPAMENLLCRVISATEIELITTDLELTIIHKCHAESKGAPFELLLPFQFFKQVVSFNKSMPIKVELENGKANILGESDTYHLGALDKVADFPKLPDMPQQNAIVLEKGFIEWIDRALIAISKDENRPVLHNVSLEITGKLIEMASSDSHILFTHSFPIESKVADQLLISGKIAKAIAKFESPTLYWRKSHIGIQNGDITVIATRLDSKFVNYKAIIPKFEKNLTVNRSNLIGALERCALSSSPSKETVIYLRSTDDSVLFEAYDQDLDRKIEARISGKYKGNAEKISINASNMLRLLAQIETEEIELAIYEPAKAILLTSEADKDYLGLLMPIAPNK